MFNMLNNLAKAAVAVAVVPVALVVDTVTMPALAEGSRQSSTKKVLRQAGEAFDAAVQPDRSR